MIKQLQNKVVALQTQKLDLETEYKKKCEGYEQTLQELENQNSKLRKFIDENQERSHQLNPNVSQKDNRKRKLSQKINHQGQNNDKLATDSSTNIRSIPYIINENELLKKEMGDLTRVYQQQINQIHQYFHRIKQAYLDKITLLTKKEEPSKVVEPDLIKLYDKMLQDFGQQRQKYIQKIEQLANHISSLEEKDYKNEEKIKNVSLQLEIVREQLRIYKRCK